MTPAEHARNAAISLEAKKDALSQKQSGDWRVTFTVQEIDMDRRFTSAKMGTRYAMVLVEIGENEEPVSPTVKEESATPQPSYPRSAVAKQARDWRDIQPAQQAGIRCGEAVFEAFLKETRPDDWSEATDAAQCVRLICGVHSRVELGTNQRARIIWTQLDAAYQAWLAKERVGA